MNAKRINHRNGSYEVFFESIADAIGHLPEDVRIVTDSNVLNHYSGLLEQIAYVKVLEPGEQRKSIAGLSELLSWLAASRASRQTTVCALGGGVIGDLTGFAAAVYMRGVPFVQIPTTLLSQVDSSVGGKVGIDLAEGKNLAGAFYPPVSVSIPTDALHSLPTRQFVNGMAEVWKYGFIMDPGLVDLLATHEFSPDDPDLASIVERCISLKARVVEQDEFETLGTRAILNYGHTVGHAIEILTGYGPVLHGEAISIGMVVEARLGETLGVTPSGVTETVRAHLTKQGLPTSHTVLQDAESLLQAMYGDKKAVAGRLAFSLLTGIGGCKLVVGVDKQEILKALGSS